MGDLAQRAAGAKEAGRHADKRAVTGPSFRFRLERVRAVRERKEKLAQQELARSISRLSSSQAELQSAEAELQSAQAEQRTSAEDTLAAVELQSRQAFLERIEQRRSRHALELKDSEADVAARNAELLRAATEHEMLNRLRDRRRVEHDRDAAVTEGKLLDEMASSRTRRSIA
jgi:flagellar export protein FliJ